MMAAAHSHELKLALLSLVSAAAVEPSACARTLDEATLAAARIDRDLIDATSEAVAAARFGAARLLNSLCGACRACARGITGEAPAFMTAAPASTADRSSREEPRRP